MRVRISSVCALILMLFGLLLFGTGTFFMITGDVPKHEWNAIILVFSGLCTLGFGVSAVALLEQMGKRH